MISNSDLEKAWFLYKTEYEPKNVSVNAFCVSKGIPYRDFNNWFRKTHKQVVPLEVEGMPVDSSASEQPALLPPTSGSAKSREGGIHVLIHTSDGLQIRKKGLTYQGLVHLVEKLEGLC